MCVRITLGYSHSKKSCASRWELIRNSLHLLHYNDRQLLTILKSLRSALGRQFVASRISRILNLRKNLLVDLFSVVSTSLEMHGGSRSHGVVVFCHEICELVENICITRGFDVAEV